MWSPVYGVTPLSPFSRSAHVQAFVGSSDEKMSVASVLKFSGQGGSETSPYCPCAIVSTYFLKLNMEFNGYVDPSRTVSAPTTSRVRPVGFFQFSYPSYWELREGGGVAEMITSGLEVTSELFYRLRSVMSVGKPLVKAANRMLVTLVVAEGLWRQGG